MINAGEWAGIVQAFLQICLWLKGRPPALFIIIMSAQIKQPVQKKRTRARAKASPEPPNQRKIEDYMTKPSEKKQEEPKIADSNTYHTNRTSADNECEVEFSGENSNPMNFHNVGGKQMQLPADVQQGSPNSNTVPFDKIVLHSDDMDTRKGFAENAHNAVKEVLSKEHSNTVTATVPKGRPPAKTKPKVERQQLIVPLQRMTLQNKEAIPESQVNTILAPLPQLPPAVPVASYNPKVEQIQHCPPLRQRFKQLLPKKVQYQIGFHNKQLLSILRGLDSTIHFLTINRSSKGCFFTDLAANIKNAINGMELTRQHLQQLLFLDPALYSVEHQLNIKIRKSDLQIRMPAVRSEDERVNAVHEKIVQYLLAKQLEFLAVRGEHKTVFTGWSEGFHPARYAIPARELPPDPNGRNAEFLHMTGDQLVAVPNAHMRNFMQSAKNNCEARSVTSQEVSNMIFSKVSVKAILSENFRQAEETNTRLQREAKEAGVVPERAILERVAEEIMLVYMSKNVTNMFRKTLVGMLGSRLTTIKADVIAQALEFVMQATEAGFLEEKRTSTNDLVLQINRGRFQQLRQKIRGLPK